MEGGVRHRQWSRSETPWEVHPNARTARRTDTPLDLTFCYERNLSGEATFEQPGGSSAGHRTQPCAVGLVACFRRAIPPALAVLRISSVVPAIEATAGHIMLPLSLYIPLFFAP